MRFNTHDRTPKPKTGRLIKIMLIFCLTLLYGMFIFAAIACSLVVHNIAPAIVILTPTSIITTFVLIYIKDMGRAYLEVDGDTIHVVDYYFGIKKEKQFSTQDICKTEVIPGYSMRVRGFRWNYAGASYIVFRGNNNRYLFKVICFPETKQFFEDYIENGRCQNAPQPQK